MAAGKEFLGRQQGLAEVLGRVVIMVQVQLDLAEAGPAEFGQGVEMLGIVLLDREEERVAGRPPIAVAKAAESRGIVAHPPRDPGTGYFWGNATHPRLEVIRDADQDMNRLARGRQSPRALKQIGKDPEIHPASPDDPSGVTKHQDGQDQHKPSDHQSFTEVSPVSLSQQSVELD